MKRIKFDCFYDKKHWYLVPTISLHNYVNQFCIWFQFTVLCAEISFMKKRCK